MSKFNDFSIHFTVPEAPADVKALVNGTQAILVSWSPPTQMNGLLLPYALYWRENGSEAEPKKDKVPSYQTSFEVFGLKMNKSYEFWVTASTKFGGSPKSKSIIATPSDKVSVQIASFDEVITAKLKRSVKLPCLVVGSPTPNITWKVRIILL